MHQTKFQQRLFFLILLVWMTDLHRAFVPSLYSQEAALHSENIVVLLDASGSMNETFGSDANRTKLQTAKNALKSVLSKLPDDINIGLLIFSTSHSTPWLYPLGVKESDRFLNAVAGVRANGGTPLGQYMKMGADALLAQREKQYNYGSYRLLVITDGKARDAHLVDAYTPAIMNRQIRVDVIGVDMPEDHMLATVVDSYRRADNPEQLIEAVSKILAETSSSTIDADEDLFELIQPLTNELARGMIEALSAVPSNQPIGLESVSEPDVESQTPPTTQPTTTSTGSSTTDEGGDGPLILIGILLVAGILFFQYRSKQKNT
ncbi:hypothetical protein CMK12_11230 [Candidatus Poribacteria bacterium]|nr:hypothetical protein [Candidatus Poribacteria bacterium]